MKIDGINASAADESHASPQAAVGKKLTEDDFLKIFLKQMTMQSPDKPLDSAEMMQQMSQLTALESNKALKTTIENMNKSIGQAQVMNATQMIGREVVVASDVSPLSEKTGLNGSVVVPEKAASVTVNIKDKENKVVKTIDLPVSGTGVVDFHWDGLNANGEPMENAFYSISASANVNGKTEELPTAGYFKVNSVTMDRQTSNVVLNLEGLGGVGVSDIIKFLA